MIRSSGSRRRQRGQVVVITALMALLIFGVLAIAVDLGVQTLSQRSLQNITDSSALAGATDLTTGVGSTQQKAAVNDALSTIQQNLGGGWSGGNPTPGHCTVGSLSGYCASGTEVSGGRSYTVRVSTPPQSARNGSNVSLNNLEVDISTRLQNTFAEFIGAPVSSVAAHAVAYHWGPPGPYDYTFFAAQQTDSGNQQETIYGDAYVGDGYQAQSSGQAGMCVYYPSGTTAYGHMIYAEYPPTIGGEPSYSDAPSPCPGGGALTAQAPMPSASGGCPSPSTPAYDPNSGTWGCVMPNPPVPDITGADCPNAPWYDGGTAASGCVEPPVCTTTINSSTYPSGGIVVVGQNCTVTLDFSGHQNGGNIYCVSLELNPGASVNVVNKKSYNYMSSYGFSDDSTADSRVQALDAAAGLPYVQPSSCPGANGSPTNADDCIVCAAPTSVSPMPVALYNNSTGCCSDTLFLGSVFLPGQEIFFNTNQAMEDVGQVYCGTWNVQSGNHPNPLVTRDVQNTTLQDEQLRLVE